MGEVSADIVTVVREAADALWLTDFPPDGETFADSVTRLVLTALRADPELTATALGYCADRSARDTGGCMLPAGHDGWHKGLGSFWSRRGVTE